MEAPFILFVIGLMLWVIKTFLSRKLESVPWYLFLITGTVMGIILSLAIGSSLLPPLEIPWYLLGIMGGIASLVIYTAYRTNLFFQRGFEYVVTLVLGGLLGIIFYMMFNIYLRLQHLEVIIHSYNTTLWFSMILMGFVIVLGYSFPERFQKRRPSDKQEVNHK